MYPLLYLATIVGVNVGFAHTTPIETALGPLPPMSFVVGIVFVLRDYVQRHIGHKVVIVMLLGCLISWFMANPMVATASLTAFVAAEAVDWLIFTLMPGDFYKRVLYSSVGGVLVDTIVFLPMIGIYSLSATLVMWTSKMLAAGAIYAYGMRR
jgi:queuosine precursor transporter